MSTITKEFTKEQLIEWAQTHKKRAEEYLAAVLNDEYGLKDLALAEIALASLEAEPVKRVNADQMHRVCLEANRHLDKYGAMAKEVNELLGRSAPPAPVSVPAAMEMDDDFDSAFEHGKAVGWNAYRAAMLQGAEQTNYRAIVERIAEIIHGKVTDIDLLTVTVKSMKDKLQK